MKKLDIINKNQKLEPVSDPDLIGPHYAGLLDKQRAFIEAYLMTGIATEAGKIAGYAPKYVAQSVSKLLKTESIIKAIEERKAFIKQNIPNPLTPEEMRIILANIARSNNSRDGDKIKAIKTHAELDGLLIKRFEGNIETHHVLNSEDLERIEKDITEGLLTCEDSNVIDMD